MGPPRRPAAWLVWVVAAALLVGAILVYGICVYVPGERKAATTACQAELSSAARERAVAIGEWVRGARDDARIVGSFPTTRSLLGARDAAADRDARDHLDDILSGIVSTKTHEGAWLFDRNAAVLAQAKQGTSPPESLVALVRESLLGGVEPLTLQADGRGAPKVMFVVPVRDAKGVPVLGAVGMLVSPARELYGIVAGSERRLDTMESLLLERTGSGSLLVSPRRPFAQGAVAADPFPASAPGWIADALAHPEADSAETRDERGVEVLASTVGVPGTPWALLVKADRAEALAPAEAEIGVTGRAAAAMLLALGAVAWAAWRSHTAGVREAVARDASRFSTLLEQVGDAILVLGHDGALRHASLGALRMYGYTREEMLNLKVADLRATQSRADAAANLERAWIAREIVYETLNLRRDGTVFPVEVNARVIEFDGEEVLLGAVRDIEARRRQTLQSQRLARFLRILKVVGELTSRESDPQKLMDGACRAILRQQGIAVAWVGRADPDGKVAILASAGPEASYLAEVEIRWDDTPLGRGPTGTCLRTRAPVAVADTEKSPEFAPWSDPARRHGFRSLCIAPIRSASGVFGALGVYSSEADACGGEMTDLIAELAADIGHALDVLAERRVAEDIRLEDAAALRDSERQAQERAAELRSLLDAVPVAVCISHDPAGRRLLCNRGLFELLGLPAPETGLGELDSANVLAMGRLSHGGRAIGVEDLPSLLVAASSGTIRGVTGDFRSTDGREIQVTGDIAPLRDASGAVVGVVAAYVNVTPERRAQRQVEILRRAIEQSPASVVITDAGGTIQYVNPKFCELTGYTAEEAIGQNPRILKSGQTSPEAYQELWARLAAGKEWRGEFRNRRKDGTLYSEWAILSPILDADGKATHYLAVKEDLTERHHAEEALERARRELAQAQKMEAVGRLAGGVAHDFNNLLSVIIGYTELTSSELGQDDPRRVSLDQVRKAADRAADLTRQLLAFSRKQVIEPRRLDLNAIVLGITKMLRRLIGEDIELETELAPGVWPIDADPGQMEQVLLNLSVNARDAMPDGGRLVLTTKNVLGAGEFVRLSVTDSGCGIPEAVRDRVFEPFFTTKGEGKGTGLGLSTVYGIVRQSGGDVWFESEIGRGTTFHVVLPRATGGVAPVAAETARATSSRRLTVLLVEDDDGVRALARDLLGSMGHHVLSANSAGDAVRVIGAYPDPIDLLLTDVVMPNGSGPDLARRIGPRIRDGRVLFMSGYLDGDLAPGAVLTPGTHLLRKPFTADGLVRKIEEVMSAPPAA